MAATKQVYTTGRLQLYSLIVILLCAFCVTPQVIAAPDKPRDWLNNDYTLSSSLTINSDYYSNKGCYKVLAPIAGYDNPQDGCVFTGQNFELFRGDSLLGIRFGSESQFYTITETGETQNPNWAYLLPDGSTFVYYKTVYPNNEDIYSVMSIYKNFTNKLAKTTIIDELGIATTAYTFEHADPDFVLHNSDGSIAKVLPYTMSWSNNRQFAIVDIVGGGIMRIDAKNLKQRAITGLKRYLSLDYMPWDTSLTASDDGNYVAVGGSYTPNEIRVYQLSGNCGDEFIDTLSVADVCPKTSIASSELESVGALNFQATHMLYFDDANNLHAYFEDYNPDIFLGCRDDSVDCSGQSLKVSIGTTGATTAKLDYLAIGDSYTSGEGDLEGGGKYYIASTGTSGGCHLSSRSYPFLLRSYWSVATNKMHSVACSGARVVEDYLSNLPSYLGQSLQLKGLSLNSKNLRQNTALDQFTPGLVPQLEFVKKYKPKIVTVMGGGNDVGFKKVLEACASSLESCSYTKNSFEKWSLDNQIDSFYNTKARLLQAIKQISPSSKIYVIGYPQFIKNGICALNSGLLSSAEISMINNGVGRLNSTLARAAQSAGVAFISTEDSLVGGRLCEGSEYMTGAVNSLISTGNPASQSSFHPNAKGQQKMAESIKNQTSTKPPRLQGSDTYTNSYASVVLDKVAVVNYIAMTATSSITQGSPVQISLPALSLLPGSIVRLFLHSDPTYLGTAMVNADGSVLSTVILPTNTPLGSHTLVLEGYSYSGEPLTYYEPVTALSNIPNDRDGDGILDEYDKCNLIPYWFDETTSKDLCAIDIPTQTVSTTRITNKPLVLSFTATTKDTDDGTIVNLLRNPYAPQPTTIMHDDNQSFPWRVWLISGVLISLLACITVVVYSSHKNYRK